MLSPAVEILVNEWIICSTQISVVSVDSIESRSQIAGSPLLVVLYGFTLLSHLTKSLRPLGLMRVGAVASEILCSINLHFGQTLH